MIYVMLWKFFWNHQKYHAMENHVRQGLTVCVIPSHICYRVYNVQRPFLIHGVFPLFSSLPDKVYMESGEWANRCAQ